MSGGKALSHVRRYKRHDVCGICKKWVGQLYDFCGDCGAAVCKICKVSYGGFTYCEPHGNRRKKAWEGR